jgi:hypothetical protein
MCHLKIFRFSFVTALPEINDLCHFSTLLPYRQKHIISCFLPVQPEIPESVLAWQSLPEFPFDATEDTSIMGIAVVN